jgi:hypothetical protein
LDVAVTQTAVGWLMSSDRYVYQDQLEHQAPHHTTLLTKTIPWQFILTFGFAVTVTILAGYKSYVTTTAEIERLQKRIETLEVFKDRAADSTFKILADVSVLQVKFTAMEGTQKRIEDSLKETGVDLKAMIRELSTKIGMGGMGLVRPQHGSAQDMLEWSEAVRFISP